MTTLKGWLEGLGSYKNVLKIQEKKGAKALSAPPLNPPMRAEPIGPIENLEIRKSEFLRLYPDGHYRVT